MFAFHPPGESECRINPPMDDKGDVLVSSRVPRVYRVDSRLVRAFFPRFFSGLRSVSRDELARASRRTDIISTDMSLDEPIFPIAVPIRLSVIWNSRAETRKQSGREIIGT